MNYVPNISQNGLKKIQNQIDLPDAIPRICLILNIQHLVSKIIKLLIQLCNYYDVLLKLPYFF